MRQARLSLKKLMLAAIILNFPILTYVFLSAYTEKREKVLNFHRKGISLSTRLRNTSIMVPGMDNRVILVQNAKNTTNSSNRTPVFDDLIDSWLPIDSTANAHYVFSAFLHKVGAKPTIRVIVALCQPSLKAKIYCELRYRDNHGNESVVTVTGSGKQLPEGSGRK